jgi:hypothetical protein
LLKQINDVNHVEIFGTVIRIWKKEDHIFARLVTCPGETVEHPPRFTLKFPMGKFKEEGITLIAGDKLKVSGWICDQPYFETLQEFVSRSKYPINLDCGFRWDLGRDVQVKRSIAAIVPETFDVLQEELPLNSVRVEGIVARAWEHKADKFARLAVYHAQAMTTNLEGKGARLRHIPHYVTVQFPGGIVEGRSIRILSKRIQEEEPGIAPHDRMIVSGCMAESFYSQSLHSFLVDARRIDILDSMPDSSQAANIWSSYSQGVILAKKLVHYT